MRKKLLFFLFTMLLSSSIFFTGCSDESKNTLNTKTAGQINTTTQTTFKLTLDDIKKRYPDTEIKNIQNINTEYVLVESQKESYANRFELYNLKTGEIDTLPTMPEYVTLEKIENENYFIFLSSGKNSESPISSFPYLIKCFRIKNAKDDNFIAVHEDQYFNLEESVQAGTKEGSVMSDVNITFDGLQVLFKPVKGQEGNFYAGTSDIPPTKTSYDKDKKQMTFEIGTSQVAEHLKSANTVSTEENQYISSYEITQKDNKIYLIVSLRDTVKKYMIQIKRLPNGSKRDGFPYFSVEFTGKD